MTQVRVTNISHQVQKGGGIACWFASSYLNPGDSVVVAVNSLPKGWQELNNIYRFDFIPDAPEIPADNNMMEQLLIMQTKMMEEIRALKATPPQQVVVVGATPEVKPSGPSGDVFVPSFEPVSESDIKVDSSKQKGMSAADLKAKFKKSKGEPNGSV
jgi:hypothetical protein